ncbi:MAG: alpha/beta fold hydrolase [Deltaproteobacteria bacterium]|nr:alpha/beta fold hydrolase [Deltaproteobacteria bacterium]
MKQPYRHLYPFQSRFMPINGHRYHYVDEGRGPAVLMLHGNPTWSFYYRHLIAALAPGQRVVAPDHIGCGLSDKPGAQAYGYQLEDRVADLESFIDRLMPDTPLTLVVHDWGGMIGMAFALRHLSQIERLVITNTSGFLPPAGKAIPLRLRLLRNIPSFAGPAVLGLNIFARAALVMAARHRLPRDVRRGLIAPYDRPQNRIATLRFVQDIPLADGDPSFALVKSVDDQLHRLRHLPMLICWGKHDFVFDLDYFHEWQRRFPDAEAHLFENAGHYLLEDEPRAVTATIQDFLHRHPIG